MILFSICDLSSWAWLLLFWLLPFLIGLLLGYLLWHKYKMELEHVRQDLNSAHNEIETLRSALKKCERSGTDLTAHALRAIHAWKSLCDPREFIRSTAAGWRYLER